MGGGDKRDLDRGDDPHLRLASYWWAATHTEQEEVVDAVGCGSTPHEALASLAAALREDREPR